MIPDISLTLPSGGSRLLLHCCCAPCAGAVVECMVRSGIRPTLFFSNSNIVPREEYELRKAELVRYAAEFSLETVDDDYDHEDWLKQVRGLEREPERGARCAVCFRYRLLRAARYAAAHGFDTLATTLATSRWKDLSQVNEALRYACETAGDGKVAAWDRDWRKGGLQQRRSEVIREQGFYNQTYCGCEFRNSPIRSNQV